MGRTLHAESSGSLEGSDKTIMEAAYQKDTVGGTQIKCGNRYVSGALDT